MLTECSEKEMMYIKKIKNNTVGRKITTSELKEKAKSILSPKTIS